MVRYGAQLVWILLVLAAPVARAEPGWESRTKGLEDKTPQSMWGSPTELFLVSHDIDTSSIYRSTDGGRAWQRLRTGKDEIYMSIWGSSPTDLFVAGGNDVLHSSDHGKTWRKQHVGDWPITSVWGSGPKDVYLAGTDHILHSVDGGRTWTTQRDDAEELTTIWGTGPQDVYAAGINGTLWHSGDHGRSWQALTTGVHERLDGVWASSPTDLYVVGTGGTLLHSVDHGATFARAPNLATTNLATVWGTGPHDIFVGAEDGSVLHSVDNGATWTPAPMLPEAFHAVLAYSSKTVFAIGASKLFARAETASEPRAPAMTKDIPAVPTWTDVGTHDREADLSGVWGSAPDDLYVVGYVDQTRREVLLHSTDGGATWTPPAGKVDAPLLAIWGTGPKDIYVAGKAGFLAHSKDRGATWQPIKTGAQDYITEIWGSSPTDIYAAGLGGAIHTGDGKHWARLPLEQSSWSGIWGSAKNDVYLVGREGTILLSTDGGKTWPKSTSGTTANLQAVWGSGGDDVWVGGAARTLLHSSDRGASWQPIEVVPRSEREVEIAAVWGTGPDSVYVVDSSSRVFRSTDHGVTWTRIGMTMTAAPHVVGFPAAAQLFVIGIQGRIQRCDGCR